MVPNSETLTPNQAARRDRVLDAALVLAVAGPGRDLYEWIDERLNPPDVGSFVALV